MRKIKKILKDNTGATLMWALSLMVVIFGIGVSIMTAASMATGVVSQYRDSKICYHYTKAVAKAISADIKGFSCDPNDPWAQIAQGVYDLKIDDSSKSIMIDNAALDIKLPPNVSVFKGTGETEITITITDQKMIVKQPYVEAVSGRGDPGDPGYVEAEDEIPEIMQIRYNMVIKLHTKFKGQEYIVYLKTSFNGKTIGAPGEGEGSGILDSGTYSEVRSFDSV